MTWDGDDYQARFDELAKGGKDVHGEAAFVEALGPATVLDAGCGTGRVAIELAHRGIDVVGVDRDRSMLDVARARAPELTWIEADLGDLDLERTFEAVVMAGNVLLFVAPGTEDAVVARTAAHVEPGGMLVAGFQLRRDGYGLAALDEAAANAGLVLEARYSTWDRATFVPASDYAVSVFRRPLQ
jgi:2-polyprenyl-3-methyl-5-hydroxy-6-metoxy-1,4-benzoquinol methylase